MQDVRPNGVLSLEDVLVKSSNIGMAQVSLALGSRRTHAYLTRLGFGRRTGISMPADRDVYAARCRSASGASRAQCRVLSQGGGFA